MEKTGRKCIECGTETYGIRIIDRGLQNIHYDFEYAAGDAKRSLNKTYKSEGKVSAEMCENCGRITLRAVPGK